MLFHKLIDTIKRHPLKSAFLLIILLITLTKIKKMYHSNAAPLSQAVYVETVQLAARPAIERLQAVGTIKAAHNIVLASEVTGTVETLAAVSGQTVGQNSILLTLRHADSQANLQRDQAILEQTETYYNRVQQLLRTHAVSQETLSEARSKFKQAAATVAADQATLDKYIIKAPFAGKTGIWQVDTGQLVRAGDTLVTLTQDSPVYTDFMLPATTLSKVRVNDAIEFTTASYPGITWHGKIIAIDPQLDSATRGIKLRAQLDDNPNHPLVPELYGTVNVIKTLPPKLFIPQEAILYDPKGASVYLVEKNKVALQPITLGAHEGNAIVVEKGLAAGDEVVTAGIMKLFPGSTVIVNKKTAQKAG